MNKDKGDPCLLSLAQMAAQVKQGQLSPVELLESLLGRIDFLEPALQAWVTVDREGATAQARRLHGELRRGKIRGPLHGVPVGIKDIYYTAGLKTTGGSRVFEDFVPQEDATSVQRLRKAGAVILGKTATTEFAYADPAPTRNPWNPEHTPGGSSSGSAAAVASFMCPAACGSQTGGSILRPAAYCGVVGLKPTYGRISRYGVMALSWSLDHVGFLTRTVEDAAILLGVLAGRDPRDPTASGAPVADYGRAARGVRRPPRIGLLRQFFLENSGEEVVRATEESVRKLRRAGAQVKEVKMPPSFGAVHDAHRIIMRTEAASYHEKTFSEHRDLYRPKIRELVAAGMLVPALDYLRALKIKGIFRREMESLLGPFECLLTPTTSSPAPRGLSSTGDPWFQSPWSFSGLPTITLPSSLTAAGLPLGLQLVGGAFAEEKLLAAARWCERTLGVSLAPPLGKIP